MRFVETFTRALTVRGTEASAEGLSTSAMNFWQGPRFAARATLSSRCQPGTPEENAVPEVRVEAGGGRATGSSVKSQVMIPWVITFDPNAFLGQLLDLSPVGASEQVRHDEPNYLP